MPNIETPEEFADRYWNSLPQGYSYHKGVLSAHIAARDAAIRAECAKKAVAYCKKWTEFPIGNHGLGALRAAIMGEQ